ncbi:MAG: hypothetical protein RID93_33670 [Sandaracinaceae bacterium]
MVKVVRSVAALVSLAVLGSCGGTSLSPPAWARMLPDDLPYQGELVVRPDAEDQPTLELRIPWGNAEASLGYGVLRLWARPGSDHVSVSGIVDAPAAQARWEGCEEITLHASGGTRHIPGEYIGRSLARSGVYEGMRVRTDLIAIRKLALAPHVGATFCGDRFVPTAEQRATLRRFVEWFEHLATPNRSYELPHYREVGPRPALPLEDPDAGEPFQA